MMINRNNYEEYFLLYLDGELEAADRLAVDEFLMANPDLVAEMDLLKATILQADEELTFAHPELLFKPVPGETVNEKNHETYFLSYIDNELNEADKSATEEFLRSQPQHKEEFDLLMQTKFSPDLNIIFPDKSVLYREEEKKRIVYMRWLKPAIAATFLGILATVWLNRPETGAEKTPAMAVTDAPKSNSGKTILPGKTEAEPAGTAIAGTEKTASQKNEQQKAPSVPSLKNTAAQQPVYAAVPAETKPGTPDANAPRVIAPAAPADLALTLNKKNVPDAGNLTAPKLIAKNGSLEAKTTEPIIPKISQDALTTTLAANQNLSEKEEDILIGNARINKSSVRSIFRKTGRLLERTANLGEITPASLFKKDKNNKKDN